MAQYDSQSSAVQQGFSTTFSWNHTLGASANLIYVFVAGVGTFVNATTGVTGVTVNGDAMTRVYTDDGASGIVRIDVYRLVSPDTGTVPIQITRAGTGYSPVALTAISVVDANVTTPDDGWTRSNENSPNSSLYSAQASVASAVDDLVISSLIASSSFTTVTSNGTQTERATATDADSRELRTGTQAGTAGTVTHSYDLQADAGDRPAYIVIANINNIASPPADTILWRAFGARVAAA